MNLSKLKTGDRIGISGGGRKVDLYCSVGDIIPEGRQMYVINGDWDLTLLNDGRCIVHDPRGDINLESGYRISYTGYIPKEIAKDYNAAMAYIDAQISKGKSGKMKKWLYTLFNGMQKKVSKFVTATKAAKNAFVLTYNGNRVKVIDLDDDIPF